MRDDQMINWFGPTDPVGDLPIDSAISQLRSAGDDVSADELASTAAGGQPDDFSIADSLKRIFTRYVKTTHLCGFLPDSGDGSLVPVTSVVGDGGLQERNLKVTLEGLHVARYPGKGRHSILFDFGLEGQRPGDGAIQPFHFNAKFDADDGETVAVRNYPLFVGLTPGPDGITFGFQTVNVASSFNHGLLEFLDSDVFKTGLSLLSAAPAVAQISGMAAGLTRWLAGLSANVKVQEFRQGLDFASGHLGGGLTQGTYVIVQIPVEYQQEWNWSDWRVDANVVRLVSTDSAAETLDFNHVMLGVHGLQQ
jgi:hypothetical protein